MTRPTSFSPLPAPLTPPLPFSPSRLVAPPPRPSPPPSRRTSPPLAPLPAGGFVAYSGNRKGGADFTPINSASGVPAESRRRLAQTGIAPAPTGSAQNINSAASGRDGNDRQAQLPR